MHAPVCRMKTFHGTDVEKCAQAYWASKQQDVTVKDCEFGTTFASSRIYTRCKLGSILVIKVPPHKMHPFPVESDIVLFRPMHAAVAALIDAERFEIIPFIRIFHLYYVGASGEVKIPNTREEMAFCKGIVPEDKLCIYRMGMESFEENFASLTKQTEKMLLGVFGTMQGVKEYLAHFGGPQYLFPACPFSKVSEALLMSHASITIKVEKPAGRSQKKKDSTSGAHSNSLSHAPKESQKDEKDALSSDTTKSGTCSPSDSRPEAVLESDPKTSSQSIPENADSDDLHGKCTGASSKEHSSCSEEHQNKPTYYKVIVLKLPVACIPSKYVYAQSESIVHVLHVKLYGLLYCYIWSDKPLETKILRAVGISERNILFHCEFTACK
ncbi:hypothetical protein NERG_01570 [Nematocida ausubeli]|uniref:Uncharacterized protein n=1 Tax=Nematocida ausubeli (strain ATCC PRA-371 / ERTm2) TaxID=1913371 RepID=H8ZD99_NEMA1|nr:hypothetical protein NERG_01570 [Nematocida ausubeli]